MIRRIAFLSDVHGNLTALEAVLRDLDRRGVAERYFLGDVLGKGPAVHEAVRLLRENCTGAVYGNWDRLVLKAFAGGYEKFGAPYYVQRLTEEDRAYITALPETVEMRLGGRTILGYHGRFSIDRVVTPMFNNERGNVENAMYRFGPHDVTVMGDAHHPFILTHQGRFLINTGAVGNPCDRIPQASYLILSDEDGDFSAQLVRVPYDVAGEISRALRTPELPQLTTYIAETATARYMRSYNAPARNAWQDLPLEVYEAHMAHEGVQQAQALNALMARQLADHPCRSVAILGVAGGNGVEHAQALPFETIYGVDINADYLAACRARFALLGDRLVLLQRDLTRDPLPPAQLVIANLLIEYTGVDAFLKRVAQAKPEAVSCVIQHNGAQGFVSASPHAQAFAAIEKLHKDVPVGALTDGMEGIGYALTHLSSHPLPSGKLLLRADFQRT